MIGIVMLSKIANIDAARQGLDLKVKVLSLNKKTIKNDRGETTYFYGIIGDDTGTVSFTAWSFPAAVKSGDVVEIKNCYSSLYNGKIRIYVDSRSQVVLKPDEYLEVKRTVELVKLRDLSLTTPYVSVIGRISGIKEKNYDSDRGSKIVYQGFIEDETAKVRISSFGKPLKDGEIVRVENARVSQYNGYMGISIGENSSIDNVQAQIEVGSRPIFIAEIKSPIGGVTITGFAVSVGQGSRIFTKCSICKKILEDGKCKDHPRAPVYLDIFGYFLLSDGTGSLTCYLNKDSFLPYIKMDTEEFKSQAFSMNPNMLIKKNILGKCLSVTGDLRLRDDKITMNASSIKEADADSVKDIEKTIQEEFQ
ncbi:TVG1242712 [Thermoplasma volcanium GSS1]|uniref:TVG1242712 protein n=1 Tax=Thermoplasma volcanium (strain ATCC 51530 / DSM 4299 / JCM 9571 / NBRC 15438 / GSS1) TaxID=273116 RepID=Q979F0_THEVO|nr:replication factor A [Thermoplasma volcanium]BAB60353.1 TVG1242712 [Thermoplasma volcanium GSS1]